MLGELVALLERHAAESGLLGVAVGRKEVDREVAADSPYCVAFFVRGKEPRRGASVTLKSGRRVLPKRVDTAAGRVFTDVVDVSSDVARELSGRMQQTRFTAGGPVGNRTEVGTMGCLVRIARRPHTYGLTNRHVAIDAGQVVYFPSFGATSEIPAVTRDAVGLLPDEKFSRLFDEPNAYIDVDAALVQIPDSKKQLFSSRIPTLGEPTNVFEPDFSDDTAYLDSLIDKRVSSWNWKSKRREGRVSHVFYTTRTAPGRPVKAYGMLIQSLDDQPASVAMDSGKVWVEASGDDAVSIVGLHQGSVDLGQGTRFAVATEMASLARLWDLKL